MSNFAEHFSVMMRKSAGHFGYTADDIKREVAAIFPEAVGTVWYVAKTGNDSNPGNAGWDKAFLTVQKAVDSAAAGDTILVAPGFYDETVTVTFAKNNLTFVGVGGRGSVGIEPSANNAEGMEVRADDVTLINFGVAGEDSGDYALRVFGRRFRAYGCKFECAGGTGTAVVIGPGTIAQIDASTHGKGDDSLFEDCEFAWSARGIDLTGSDYGACTQTRITGCLFHNIATCHIRSNTGSVSVRDVWVVNNTFARDEAGTEPTDYLLLNVTGDTGLVTGNRFATATLAAAVITLASGVRFVGNYAESEGPATGGGTAGQPD